MKFVLKFLLGLAASLCLAGLASAQQSPVMTVSITNITASGSGPNENYGPAGTAISITALAVGTFPTSGFTYNFTANGQSIGSADQAAGTAISVPWTPPEPGVYFIQVTASDGTNTATSLAVRFFSTGTKMTSPVSGSLVPTASSVVLQAAATAQPAAPAAFVSRIDFIADGVLIGSDTTYPYSLIYTPLTAGNHTVQAIGYDNLGNVIPGTALVDTISLSSVTAIGTPPTISIATPPHNTAIAIPTTGNTIPVSISANSPTGVITKVELYIDGVLFGTDNSFPYSFDWIPTVVGTYRLVALAYDDKNNVVASTTSTGVTTTPAPTSVIIAAPPTVSISSPANGGTVPSGTPSQIAASATDSGGNSIAAVQFFVNGTFVGQATSPQPGTNTYVTTATFTQQRDSTGAVIPSVITALATNSIGLSGTSTGVSVTVTAGGGGGPPPVVGNPPAVTVTSPTAASQVPVNVAVPLTASATDTDGNIVSVQFLSGTQVVGTVTTYPYIGSWTPTSLGAYAITARATDNDGNIVTSTVVPITVVDPNAAGPTVSIISPSPGVSVLLGPQTIMASATSSGSIRQVQFFVNGQALSTDTTFPYTATWNPASPGTYNLSATATDNVGKITTTGPVAVTVNAPGSPAVSLTAPSTGSNSTVNVPVPVTATATSPSSTIASVQFFANGQPIGTSTSFPYGISWTPTVPGTYVVTAVATDGFGLTTTSAGSSITIGASSSNAPTIALTGSPTNTFVTVNTPVPLLADARDSDGAIASVQFLVNGQVIDTTATAPYRTIWVPNAAGTYNITAIATDNVGNRTTSSASVVTVRALSGLAPVASLFFNDPALDTPTGTTTTTPDPFVPVRVSYGSKLLLTASAVDQDGSIASVQFFVNGATVATVTSAPFFTVYDLNTLSDVVVTAIVTDSAGNAVYTNPLLIDTQPSTSGPASAVNLISPRDGGTYVTGQQIIFSATHNFGTVNPPKIDFYINGNQFSTVSAAPYQTLLGIVRAGVYTVHAVARSGTITTVSAAARITVTSNSAPLVSISNPIGGGSFVVGTGVTIAANASDPDGTIQNVQFLVNGTALSTDDTTPYTAAWNPGAAGIYTLNVLATDNAGNQTLSNPVVVTLTGNQPPSVSITSPTAGTSITAGRPVTLTANATDADGTVAGVRFLANGVPVANSTAAPFTGAWTPSAAGTYALVAQATDNSGNVTSSSTVTVTVVGNNPPTVSITSPSDGTAVRVGAATTLIASAADADGTIVSVQFFANGTAVGAAVTTPAAAGGYRTQWQPTAEGVYRLTAVALDNAGSSTTSSTITVVAILASSTDTIYGGSYLGAGENGRFAFVNVRGRSGTFIGFSTSPTGRTYFYPSLALDAAGGFIQLDATGRTLISGSVSDTGASGTLDNGRLTFIGPVVFSNSSSFAGYYVGSLAGRSTSTLSAIVAADGTITAYVTDGGSFRDAGSGTVTSTGAFSITTPTGTRIAGTIDAVTGSISGTLTGGPGGTFTGGVASGISISDGALRNLSTRGQVGTGANILIAGFVVGGTTEKRVLVRAIGPALTGFGVTGAIADPQLEVYSGNTRIATNDNWGGGTALQNAMTQVGAFPLLPSGLDSALLLTLQPGSYTAQVSGAFGQTGVALVELYDLDSLSPFSAQKVMNVATRGVVGTGSGQLIAGFVITGNLPKKVLVRGIGPSLASVGITSGFLADPVLRIVRTANGVETLVRDNDNWESGNDGAVLSDVSRRVGAFALTAGSRDAAILINLPPGSYTAQLTGAGSTTGIGLIEVYEVP